MSDMDSALKFIYDSLSDGDITWALTGSFAFHIRGMNVSVGDIDIQTDKNGAYEIARRLKQYVIEPIQFRQAPKIRSHFGKLLIDGTKVEVMGDIEKLAPDGTWLATPSLQSITETVLYNNMDVPVLDLGYEYHAYALMGRVEKARLLQNWMNRSQTT